MLPGTWGQGAVMVGVIDENDGNAFSFPSGARTQRLLRRLFKRGAQRMEKSTDRPVSSQSCRHGPKPAKRARALGWRAAAQERQARGPCGQFSSPLDLSLPFRLVLSRLTAQRTDRQMPNISASDPGKSYCDSYCLRTRILQRTHAVPVSAYCVRGGAWGDTEGCSFFQEGLKNCSFPTTKKGWGAGSGLQWGLWHRTGTVVCFPP